MTQSAATERGRLLIARKITDLTVSLSGAPVEILRTGNDAFLRGARPEPVLDTLWDGWKPIALLLLAAGTILTGAAIAVLAYLAVWNSPLAVTTTGTIDTYRAGRVAYHYDVDGVRYDKDEPVNRSSSNWDDGNVPHPVVYLTFLPSESRLDFNVEQMDLGTAFFMLVFASLVPYGGWLLLRSYRRMTGLRDGATHVIDGSITQVIRGPKGMQTFVYTATSPASGREIRGTFDVGRQSPRQGRVRGVGSTVAVLYQSDSLHAAL